MPRVIKLNENQWDFLKEEYPKKDLTLSQIAEQLGVSVETVRRRAKSIGLERPKDRWTKANVKWLKNNFNKTYKEMSQYLGMSEEVIRVKINELGIVRTSVYRPFKLDMNDKEFLSDLENPRLSAPDIVRKYEDKYGIGESRIHQLRKEREIKLQLNTIGRESSLERKVRKYLESLDLAYIQEKRVGKYNIDFYLGFKACIEAHGAYWHSRPERIKSDERKANYLKSKGYKVLYIWENEMQDMEKNVLEFIKELGFPIQ